MPTDAQIHENALFYAKKFNVSYEVAVKAVAELIPIVLAGKQLPAAVGAGADSTNTDAQLDAKAKAYAKANNVSYSEAIGVVCSFAGVGSSSAVTAGTNTDAALDAQAKAYAKAHNVSYSEAIGVVCSFAGVGSSSAVTAGTNTDAALDAQAKAYAKAHNVSYSEAIGVVCSFSAGDEQMVSFSEASPVLISQSAANAIRNQLVEIFRAGQHISDDGQALSFSASDIRSMAAAYTPSLREAPLVVGHPANNHPAYGWVKGLTASHDGRLLMQTGQVEPAFAEMVAAGRFKKRSASFYHPQHPGNPRPGSWYLRHVGWLGAQQPAIAGLKDLVM